jgi:small-conductance mechanosensitive channel
VGSSIASLSYYALLLLGLLVALSAAGFDVSQLTLLLGALGVGIGFGLQNVVGNFVAGLVLMFERPIRPGDVIEIPGTSGTVSAIGLRATRLRTFDGAEVVVPNGTLLGGNLTNWTLADRRRRVEVPVGVAYGSKPAQVIDLLRGTAAATPGVATTPPPFVWFTGFGASSLDFLVRAWCDDYDASFALRSELVRRIHDALDQAGIAIPFPQQDLHLRSVSEAAGTALRAGPATPSPADAAPPDSQAGTK